MYSLDESDVCFRFSGKQSRPKAVGCKRQPLLRSIIKTKNIEHVTVMSVILTDGTAAEPVVAYPGVQTHYRLVRGTVEKLNYHLMPCYLYQRDPIAGGDREIFDG